MFFPSWCKWGVISGLDNVTCAFCSSDAADVYNSVKAITFSNATEQYLKGCLCMENNAI